MKIVKYPDETSYAVVHPVQEFTFRINSYEDLWHLNQTVNALNNQGIRPTITIPNLIDAQADRRFNSNESSGLKLVNNCSWEEEKKGLLKIIYKDGVFRNLTTLTQIRNKLNNSLTRENLSLRKEN